MRRLKRRLKAGSQWTVVFESPQWACTHSPVKQVWCLITSRQPPAQQLSTITITRYSLSNSNLYNMEISQSTIYRFGINTQLVWILNNEPNWQGRHVPNTWKTDELRIFHDGCRLNKSHQMEWKNHSNLFHFIFQTIGKTSFFLRQQFRHKTLDWTFLQQSTSWRRKSWRSGHHAPVPDPRHSRVHGWQL